MNKNVLTLTIIFMLSIFLVEAYEFGKEPDFLKNIGPGSLDNQRVDNPWGPIIVILGVFIASLFIYFLHNVKKYKFMRPVSNYFKRKDKEDKKNNTEV